MIDHPPQNAFDSRKLPKARSFQAHTCGKCPNVHVIFFREDGEAEYQAILSKDQACTVHARALLAETECGFVPERIQLVDKDQ